MTAPEYEVPRVIVTKAPHTDENKERGNWSSQVEFLLSCLSYAVGLGNIWRFPYLCYRNGGGAFLIPYSIMLVSTGLPLFFLELSFGQYASEGPITIWKISPLFQGIGYAMFLMSTLIGIYYNMILAWALFYLVSSLTSHLPWNSCDNWWNSHACRKFDFTNCTISGGIFLPNGTCANASELDPVTLKELNATESKMASDEYFHNYVLDMTEGLHDLGSVRWQLALCLLMCWIIVFLCLSRGVKTMGKAVYFTALFPYFILVILLIRTCTLDGAMDGIRFYLTPKWEKLREARVWGDAAMQIFFSLSPCWGGLITLASFNKFHNNCFRDALFICFGNCGTSFFAGFVIFSTLGFMAHKLGVQVSDVAAQGAGLAFIVYPEAVTHLPLPPLWSFLFFFMLMTLGMGTQFTIVETVVTTIVDTWPKKLRSRETYVLLGCCIVLYLAGVIMCSQGGMYVLQLVDNYAASFSALITGFFEVVAISWVYGIDRFLDDIKVMLGHYPYHRRYWRFVWKYKAPVLIMLILIFSWIDLRPSQYGSYVYPQWATGVGWMISLFSVSAIPIVALFKICSTTGSLKNRIEVLSKPTPEWGPKLWVHQLEAKGQSPRHSHHHPTESQIPLTQQNSNADAEDDLAYTAYFSNRDNAEDNDSDGEGGIQLTIVRKANDDDIIC